MGRLCCGLVGTLLILCSFAVSIRGEIDVDAIADSILEEDSLAQPIKALDLLKVTDPLQIKDEPESDSNEISARFNWGKLGSVLMRIGRALSQATRTKLLSFFRGIRKATNFVLNKMTKSVKQVWEKLKSKIPGNLKNKMRKAGKKLMKKVLREVFEEAAELTLEYVQALVLEYIKTKSEEELCQCPIEDDTDKCRCCIKPPGMEKACMVIRARPKLQWFVLSFRYNQTEFLKAKIAEDERGPCQKNIVDLSRKVCRNLPHYLHFLNMCFTPGAMYETEDGGFVGCFQLNVKSIKLGLERCLLYTPPESGTKGTLSMFTPEELGLEEE